jgi:uncharacterized protein (DUF1330 family)
MPAYCLFDNVEVTDPDALADYASRTLATIRAYSGRYLVIGGDVELKEGTSMVHFPVLIEFPTLDAANAWYDSPEYAPLKRLRHGAGRFNAIFMAGLPRLAEAARSKPQPSS